MFNGTDNTLILVALAASGPLPKLKGTGTDFDSTPANVTGWQRLYEMTVEISFVSLVIAPYWCVSCEMAHCKEQLQPRGNRGSDGHLMLTSLNTHLPAPVGQLRTHTNTQGTQVMLYYADLLKVNLITLVIPDHRVFLPAKKSQVAVWGQWRKTWQQIKKWFHEGGTKDECGRVATCGARRVARRSEAILRASTPRPRALVARTERLLGLKPH